MTPDNERARALIARPLDWPRYPKLPLMRREGSGELDDCGYLWAGDVTALRVHIGNILLPPSGEFETFATVDELLSKWRVD